MGNSLPAERRWHDGSGNDSLDPTFLQSGVRVQIRSGGPAHVLSHLPREEKRADILVGLTEPDDAGVIQISDECALVQTVDFFTPVVDDPYAFGQIAAANSLSDIYAMGAEPLTVLNLVAFSVNKLDPSLLVGILRGAADKVKEAGAVTVGGHSIDDPEPKFGLAVTGQVHPDRIWRKGGARPGTDSS